MATVSDNRTGWVRFYRVVIENGWLRDHKLWAFWSYCLLKANHKEATILVGGQQLRLLPGQFWMGRKKAAEDLNMSEQNIRTCLRKLEKLENITTKPTNRGSLITVVNWSLYQSQGGETNQQDNRCLTSNQPAANHRQEVKKERREKRKAFPLRSPQKPKEGAFTDEEF